jgi:hypothetical protein
MNYDTTLPVLKRYCIIYHSTAMPLPPVEVGTGAGLLPPVLKKKEGGGGGERERERGEPYKRRFRWIWKENRLWWRCHIKRRKLRLGKKRRGIVEAYLGKGTATEEEA